MTNLETKILISTLTYLVNFTGFLYFGMWIHVFAWFLTILIFLKFHLFNLKELERSSIFWITSPNVQNWVVKAGSKEDSCRFPKWMPGPKALSHSLLLSQDISRHWIASGVAGTQTGAHLTCWWRSRMRHHWLLLLSVFY